MSDVQDLWQKLRAWTQARVGLARSGHAISTNGLLSFQRAHALARDAVWTAWQVVALQDELEKQNEKPIVVASQVDNRGDFLKRPDLGRKLAADQTLPTTNADITLVISDGLSAKAIQAHFLPLWKIIRARLRAENFSYSIILAPFGRVAIGDAIGERTGAKMVIVFIGERPGLSSTDSLGIYLTYAPARGRSDADRNCISNVRPPQGLGYELATDRLFYLIHESLRLRLSGVALKDLSGGNFLPG